MADIFELVTTSILMTKLVAVHELVTTSILVMKLATMQNSLGGQSLQPNRLLQL